MSIILKFRSSALAAGAPSSLKTGEFAVNQSDGIVYYGHGVGAAQPDGTTLATEIKSLGSYDTLSRIAALEADGDAAAALAAAQAAQSDVDAVEVQIGTADYSALGVTLTDALVALKGSVDQTIADVGTLAALTTTDQTSVVAAINEVDAQVVLAQTDATQALADAGAAQTAANTAQSEVDALETVVAGKANTVHTHDASDITSGVLDIARIPVLPSQKQIVSSGDLTALTAPQQAEIGQGTIVTVASGADAGTRYVYSGTGDKTLAANYITLADVTPTWSSIESKPSTFAPSAHTHAASDITGLATVATSGSYSDLLNLPTLFSGAYADLSGKPTLGTIASQAASNVSITGGSITGTTINGGTF